MLLKGSHRATYANCVGRAMRLVKSGNIDLILLEVDWPDDMGFRILNMLSHLDFNAPPVVVISACDDHPVLQRASSLGASAFARKGAIGSKELLALVIHYSSGRHEDRMPTAPLGNLMYLHF